MAKIGLIDVDYNGSFPNIALMKISAYHKEKGDDVMWYSPFEGRFDKVYKSKVFSFSQDFGEVIQADEVVSGGSGYAIRLVNGREVFDKTKDIPLPSEIEGMYPDYSLYPKLTDNTAYGFMTRGCPRGCPFCIVGKKEGLRSRKVADLSQFWRGQRNIVLCDPNILACEDWRDLLQQLIDSKAYIDFNQGLDIRLMTEEKAEMLNKIKIKEIHFAWDNYKDKEKILPKLKMFAEISRIKPHSHHAIVYVLVNFNSTFEQDLERIYTLREMEYWAYVMIYDKEHCEDKYRKLQRWCNNRFVFSKVARFEDYARK